ncbi:MAG: hypothetical protein LPK00_06090 [Bacillaceae bacterium]|nr:hypothetical protein [Bacillaceae bacterium]
MLVLAIILGGLMIYFLTPMKNEAINDFEQHKSKGISLALKNSFFFTTFHKKAVLALLLLLVTISIIWWSQLQVVSYNAAHGILSKKMPTDEAVRYIIGFSIYTFSIYLLLILRRTIKLL